MDAAGSQLGIEVGVAVLLDEALLDEARPAQQRANEDALRCMCERGIDQLLWLSN